MADTDTPTTPDLYEAPGWVILDPDGNVVDSGPLIEALAAADSGEAETEGAE